MYEYGRVVIRRSTDGGVTWSGPASLMEDSGYHTAPVPIAIQGGRLWRGMEFHPPGRWGFFEAMVMSAPADADLLDPANWRFSGRLPYPKQAAGEGEHWLEGNLIANPRGDLRLLLRVANIEKAAVVRVNGSSLAFERLVPFPGGAKKFTIRYDARTKRD